jgi:uncharacterized protein YsxB (DUF464 family)
MINAEIYKQEDGKIIGFLVSGHANTAKRGFDIYCAAVSMMSQSTFLCLRDHLKRDMTGEAKHGKLLVQLKDAPDDLTEVAFQTMLIGLREVEKIAPQIVKVKEKILGGEIQ